MIKILALGDVVGRSGRDAVIEALPILISKHNVDFTIVNVDNAAHGFGINSDITEAFLKAGVNCLTGGDHVWDQKGTKQLLEKEKRLLRPLNYPADCAGKGSGIFETKNGKRIGIIHLMGQVFMKYQANCPFYAAREELAKMNSASLDAVVVDFHAEATSEKNAMGVFLDGKVSAVFGTHTHVPTADARILPGGTAYITDLGMCGDYNGSIIGFKAETPIETFLTKAKSSGKMEPASGDGSISGVIIEVNTGKTSIAYINKV